MTAQFGNVIHYKGERLQLIAFPLDSFWDDSHPEPQFVNAPTFLVHPADVCAEGLREF